MPEDQDHIHAFLDYLRHEQDASPMTIDNYAKDLRDYKAYVEDRLGEYFVPSEGDLDLVRSWLSMRLDSGSKASSIGKYLASLKSFYRYLLKVGVLKQSPIQTLRPPKAAKPLPVFVPTDEMTELLEAEVNEQDWKQVRDRLILTMLYECGLRRSELAGLSDAAVDTDQRQLRVLGKGRKERIIPFGESLAQGIIQWRALRTQVFGSVSSFFVSADGSAMKPSAVYQVAHTALATVPNLARRGAHVLRHTFATDMLNSGADLMLLRELMGHNSVSTTVRYTHTSFEQLKQIYQAHPRAHSPKDEAPQEPEAPES